MIIERMNQEVKDIIIKYGSQILCSEAFRTTFHQTHHVKTTVGAHTMGVTVEAVQLSLSHGITDDQTLRNIVTSCLYHDIGLVGRDDKYRNTYQTLIRHPRDSARAYMELTGEKDERVLNAIRTHMFPVKPFPPAYKEGWILTLADKIFSIREMLKIPTVSDEEIKELLMQAEKELDA